VNTAGEVFFSHHGSRQDKSGVSTARHAANQPYRHDADNKRSQKLVPYTTQIPRYVKEEIHRVAKREKVSDSAIGSVLLTRGIQQNADMQYGALLEPVIREIITKELNHFVNRFISLHAHEAYDTGQTKILLHRLLSFFLGDESAVQIIEAEAEREARANITRHTPQVDQVIADMKREEGGGEY